MIKFENIKVGNIYYCIWDANRRYINEITEVTDYQVRGLPLWSDRADRTEFALYKEDGDDDLDIYMTYLCHIDELAGTTVQAKFPELFI